KDPANVARGLKAAINNPRVSQEAKEHDKQRLRELGEQVPGDTGKSGGASVEVAEEDEHSNRVLGGYKATLKS
ncbi:hypothetical protein FA15DRAFT_576498, partial [Coprinopsis marcescibilis]